MEIGLSWYSRTSYEGKTETWNEVPCWSYTLKAGALVSSAVWWEHGLQPLLWQIKRGRKLDTCMAAKLEACVVAKIVVKSLMHVVYDEIPMPAHHCKVHLPKWDCSTLLQQNNRGVVLCSPVCKRLTLPCTDLNKDALLVATCGSEKKLLWCEFDTVERFHETAIGQSVEAHQQFQHKVYTWDRSLCCMKQLEANSQHESRESSPEDCRL